MARSSAKPVSTGGNGQSQQGPASVPTDDGQTTSGAEGAETTGATAGTDEARTEAAGGRNQARSQGSSGGGARQAAASTDQNNRQSTDGDNAGAGDPIEELKQQHRKIEALLTAPDAGDDVAGTIERFCEAWLPHTAVEEDVIVPAIEKVGGGEKPALAEAEVRRDVIKLLLADLRGRGNRDPLAAAKLTVLADEVEALIAIEERPDTGLLALAGKHGVDLNQLRDRIADRRRRFQSDTEGESIDALEPSSLRLRGSTTRRQQEEYSNMPSSNYRERDEEGRFTSGNGRGGGTRTAGRERDENGRFMSDDDRGYSSRSSRYDDDDDDRRGRGNDRPRDENGRFMSDDDRGYSSRSRSSRYDDDDDDGRGRGHGGWFGDPEGHSEASRRGWEERDGNGYRASGRDYDERRYSRSSRDDDYSRDRGQGGWFGDSEGHSEAARRGWDERERGGYRSSGRDYDERRYMRSSRDDDYSRDRGQGGWFGDPEGHSEAARRGWDEREGNGYRSRGSDYDERRYSRSSRDDDDDRRSGRGQGGWFGDPQGHSEASRRGWENRR